MFTATINDTGLSYSSENISDIGQKLNDYIIESYGTYTVVNVQKEETYNSCKIITSPGEYLITPNRDSKNQIYCKIS